MLNKEEFNKIAELFGVLPQEFYLLMRNPDIFYCNYKIPKKRGGYREISSPSLKLMAMQRAILKQILMPNFNPLPCCVGYVKDKNILDNVIPHINNPYLLKTDLEDFFPSITKEKVIYLFIKLGFSTRISMLLAALCCKKGALPQGAPTSPIISNMIMQSLDVAISEECARKNFAYTRYADDITISSKEIIDVNFFYRIQDIIKSSGMSLNEGKTHFYGPGNKKIITGVSISSGKPKLPRKTKRKLRQEVNMIEKYGLLNHMERTQQMSPIYIMSLKGKLAFWKQVEPDCPFVNKSFAVLQKAIERLD